MLLGALGSIEDDIAFLADAQVVCFVVSALCLKVADVIVVVVACVFVFLLLLLLLL